MTSYGAARAAFDAMLALPFRTVWDEEVDELAARIETFA